MLKNSTTKEILRSQIKLAAYNPRKKNDLVVKKLIKNFKSVGFLGGIVWNEKTEILISGHKRIEALDIINKYDETNDYSIKVEAIELDEKTEKEQNIFMNSADVMGEFDFELLSVILPDLNLENTGLSIETIELINFETPNEIKDERKKVNDFQKLDEKLTGEDLINKRKEVREIRNNIEQQRNNASIEKPYLIILFNDFEEKTVICEHFKIDIYENKTSSETIFKDLL